MATKRVRAIIGSKNCNDPVIDYKNIEYLTKFLTPQGQILSRRRTGFCTQCQRQLKKAIKQARQVALLPFVA
jgi:small subunit ribosomal protein S18|tara:strand:- start:579 stop:794 length:216 start_codon:yes stop_codon:yes gene_type:complete